MQVYSTQLKKKSLKKNINIRLKRNIVDRWKEKNLHARAVHIN